MKIAQIIPTYDIGPLKAGKAYTLELVGVDEPTTSEAQSSEAPLPGVGGIVTDTAPVQPRAATAPKPPKSDDVEIAHEAEARSQAATSIKLPTVPLAPPVPEAPAAPPAPPAPAAHEVAPDGRPWK